MASIFANVEVGPKIEVFALNKLCQEDKFQQKVNLGVGGKCNELIYLLLFVCFILIRKFLRFHILET